MVIRRYHKSNTKHTCVSHHRTVTDEKTGCHEMASPSKLPSAGFGSFPCDMETSLCVCALYVLCFLCMCCAFCVCVVPVLLSLFLSNSHMNTAKLHGRGTSEAHAYGRQIPRSHTYVFTFGTCAYETHRHCPSLPRQFDREFPPSIKLWRGSE